MKTLIVLFVVATGLSSAGHAENFVCQGTGRFTGIGQTQFNLEWRDHAQKILFENEGLKVQASIDKANSDGTHYLEIEIIESVLPGGLSIHGAKGSIKDMVQYFESPTSQVLCLRVPN